MSQEKSPRLGLPFLYAAQAQKELFLNESLILLDAMVQLAVESASQASVPASPVAGQAWIVPASASGVWGDKAGQVAIWTDGGWRYLLPLAGMRAFICDEGCERRYSTGQWLLQGERPDGFYRGSERLLSTRQGAIAGPTGGSSPDAECRAVVEAILTALRQHGLIAM